MELEIGRGSITNGNQRGEVNIPLPYYIEPGVQYCIGSGGSIIRSDIFNPGLMFCGGTTSNLVKSDNNIKKVRKKGCNFPNFFFFFTNKH